MPLDCFLTQNPGPFPLSAFIVIREYFSCNKKVRKVVLCAHTCQKTWEVQFPFAIISDCKSYTAVYVTCLFFQCNCPCFLSPVLEWMYTEFSLIKLIGFYFYDHILCFPLVHACFFLYKFCFDWPCSFTILCWLRNNIFYISFLWLLLNFYYL